MFNCHLEEATEPIENYPSLAKFFTRRLKPGARPLGDGMVSPCDGKVYSFGEIDDDQLTQVKGVHYSLQQFLGKPPATEVSKKGKGKKQQHKKLYHCAIYLAPGDYHGVHSPVDWSIQERRHFPGYLFPVAPVFVNFVAGLFALNERVVLLGNWKHGLYSLSPVGATNVGSISLDFEPELKTNVAGQNPEGGFFSKTYPKSIVAKKGDPLAMFHLGSTVILVFECTDDFQFNLKVGQVVKLGQSIGTLGTGSK